MLRNRATLIVKTPKGILLVNHLILGKIRFALPGGGIKFHESPQKAAERELREETYHVAKKIKFLFNHKTPLQNHFVFLVEASGNPKKSWETPHFKIYNDKVKILKSHKRIIEKYLHLS